MDDRVALALDDAHLRKLQLELLEILIEFDRICRKADIRYYIAGGTLLGAVRHKGFIPWDDDVDVELLREDYEKFCRVCEQELDHERYFFQSSDNDPGYRWLYGKLRRKDTEYIRVWQGELKQKTGLCIDVFPLDDAADSEWRQKILYYGCAVCRKILWAPVGARQCESMYKRFLFRLLCLIPKSWPLAWARALRMWGKCEGKSAQIVSYNEDSVIDQKYQRDWVDNLIEMEFEGLKFLAPKGYDGVLKLLYGDYMEFPPPDKRVGKAFAALIRFSDGEVVRADGKAEIAIQ